MTMDEAQIVRLVRELALNYRTGLLGATSAMDAIASAVLPSLEDDPLLAYAVYSAWKRAQNLSQNPASPSAPELPGQQNDPVTQQILGGVADHGKLPPVARPRTTDGHPHRDGQSWHPGWKGHDGYAVHRHSSDGRTEWEKPAQELLPHDDGHRRFP